MQEEMIRLFLCETNSFDEYGTAKIDNVENLGTAITVTIRDSEFDYHPETKTIDMLDLMTWFYGRTRNVNQIN